MNILTRTADGSNTLFNDSVGEYYHSTHGALQESQHVFIDMGLKCCLAKFPRQIHILEVGFGTGLNFMLSMAHCEKAGVELDYTGIEAYPLSREIIASTGYENYLPEETWKGFLQHYENALVACDKLTATCSLHIAPVKLESFQADYQVDLLYYDAFSVRHQPEMWTDEIIAYACSFLKPGGTFVSYAITGNLKRALIKCGLTIEKLPGAPGKREMIRGTKSYT